MINHYRIQGLFPYQCGATIVQTIHAPLPLVWSILRRFDRPQSYMIFVKSCTLLSGDGSTAGAVREMEAVSGLPLARSTERLEKLDDDLHVMIYSIIGGDHRLVNYKSTTTLHEMVGAEAKEKKTVVIESYVVDVPEGNSEEETCTFVSTILGSNLKSLAKICEKIAVDSDCDQVSSCKC